MPSAQERTPRERETLIFHHPEEAEAFAERVDRRVRHEAAPGVHRNREIIAEEVAAEFATYGEGVSTLSQPWEHSEDEHAEVQQLVDVAFEQDLSAALKAARVSDSYPRTIDLFHDVLTGEMYDLLRKRGLNQQRLTAWPLTVSLVVVVVVLFVILLLVLFG